MILEEPVEDEEKKTRQNEQKMQVRVLRHELAKWKHQVELVEAKRPRQEDEIIRLKAELTHTLDILTSTQHAVKHHEVEREFQSPAPVQQEGEDLAVPLQGGGHSCIEAHVERQLREGIEGKNVRLSGKAKRLGGVVAAQQLLIQRLEKQVLKDEHQLEQKDNHLHSQNLRVAQLKKIVRTNSDTHVARMLGVASMQPGRGTGPSNTGSVMSMDNGMSASAPMLPPI